MPLSMGVCELTTLQVAGTEALQVPNTVALGVLWVYDAVPVELATLGGLVVFVPLATGEEEAAAAAGVFVEDVEVIDE
jgi:hypothetical protein